MQKDYVPDGWLGIILGSKIFIHYMKYSFEECTKRLLAEITSMSSLKEDTNIKKVSVSAVRAVAKFHHTEEEAQKENNPTNWTYEQVSDWLRKLNNETLDKLVIIFLK